MPMARLLAFTERPYLRMHHCSISCQRQPSQKAPPCRVRGRGDSVSLSRQHRAKGPLRAPSAPAGHLPLQGRGLYMGRFVNRPYRNYSLFISEAASLFNIHSSPCIIPFAFPGDIVQTATLFLIRRQLKNTKNAEITKPRIVAEGNHLSPRLKSSPKRPSATLTVLPCA